MSHNSVICRVLTPKELEKAWQEQDALNDWTTARDLARRYGPKCVAVEVETYPESDDEGGSYQCVDSIQFLDAQEGICELDMTFPACIEAFHEWIADKRSDHEQYYGNRPFRYAHLDVTNPEHHEEIAGLIEEWINYTIRDTMPTVGMTYDLLKPPALTFPTILVPVGEVILAPNETVEAVIQPQSAEVSLADAFAILFNTLPVPEALERETNPCL